MGRACPRVDLFPWNQTAARAAALQLPMLGATGGYLEQQKMMVEALFEETTESKFKVLSRVYRALHVADDNGESVASIWMEEQERKRPAAKPVGGKK